MAENIQLLDSMRVGPSLGLKSNVSSQALKILQSSSSLGKSLSSNNQGPSNGVMKQSEAYQSPKLELEKLVTRVR